MRQLDQSRFPRGTWLTYAASSSDRLQALHRRVVAEIPHDRMIIARQTADRLIKLRLEPDCVRIDADEIPHQRNALRRHEMRGRQRRKEAKRSFHMKNPFRRRA